MNERVTVLTSENWESEVLASREPVLVDFWAEWCAPCRLIAPTIDALAGEFAGRVKVGKLDVDAHEAVAMRYGVRAIPTLLLFRDGNVVDQRVGAAPRGELQRLLETHAGAGAGAER